MGSSRRCANMISSIASFAYFLVIILQFPLFRVPCRAGMCQTPLESTCSQLIAIKLIPKSVVKSLLYPGAFANALFTNNPIPNYNNFLDSIQLANVNLAYVISDDLQRLEVVAGSYMCVSGSFVGLMKPGRMSLFGTLLVISGLSREIWVMRKSDYTYPEEDVYIYPSMFIAMILAALSVRKDVRKIYRSCKSRPMVKPKLV